MATQLISKSHALESLDQADKPAQESAYWDEIISLSRHRPALTLLCVMLLSIVPLFIPGLKRFREMLPETRLLVVSQHQVSREGSGPVPAQPPHPMSTGTAVERPGQLNTEIIPSGISDDSHVLDSFYASLAKTDAKEPGAITRITHYGDSPITNDGITGTIRHELQVRFGDGGHGFILMDRPWAWYAHDAIRFEPSGSWSSEAIGPRSSPSMFGLGGVVTRSSGAGASTRFSTVAKGDTGRNFTHLELYYLSQPGGGDLSIKVNSGQAQAITTATENTHSGFFDLRAPSSGENAFEITATRGEITVFGAVLENDGPGIVYDSLGVNGAYAGLLMTAMDQQHWTEQLRHRNPNLVVLNYGTNESQYAGADQIKHYEEQLREVVRRVHEALPGTPVLIVAPMDRGQLAAGGKIVTKPAIPMIVDMQRRVALETQCAFFDTYLAMGGEGTMAKWRTASPPLVRTDLTHPTAEGSATVGRLISNSILAGYEQYKSRKGPLISQ